MREFLGRFRFTFLALLVLAGMMIYSWLTPDQLESGTFVGQVIGKQVGQAETDYVLTVVDESDQQIEMKVEENVWHLVEIDKTYRFTYERVNEQPRVLKQIVPLPQ